MHICCTTQNIAEDKTADLEDEGIQQKPRGHEGKGEGDGEQEYALLSAPVP